MTDVQEEIDDVKRRLKAMLPDVTDIYSSPNHVSVRISKTKHKTLTATFHLKAPYPNVPALVELNSKLLSRKFLDKLTQLCEEECRKLIERRQIIPVMKFINQVIDENPLCVCHEEITNFKKKLEDGRGEMKLKQKTSTISVKIGQAAYWGSYHLVVPNEYPEKAAQIAEKDSNFPNQLRIFVVGQAKEVARKCVEKPLKPNPKAPPFEVRPSVEPVLDFIFAEFVRYVSDICRKCEKKALPDDPKEVINDEFHDLHVERILCGHLYHYRCVVDYIKAPPFTGVKKCHACNTGIYHDKIKLDPRLAEARWAAQQARDRELEEVAEFLQ